MATYLNNFKWIISKQEEPKKNLTDKTELELNPLNSKTKSDSDSDCEKDYAKINNEDLQTNINEIKNEYDKIHTEMINKEQLVRNRLDSDTIEQIKSNCEEYVNDDIKIIKDFALVMESFNHIKKKLKEFESGINSFESEILIKTSNQDENNAELDSRINQIDIKLENTIKLMEQIEVNNDNIMEKIVKLENAISAHSTQRHEILTKLDTINTDTYENNYGSYYQTNSNSNSNSSDYLKTLNSYFNLNNVVIEHEIYEQKKTDKVNTPKDKKHIVKVPDDKIVKSNCLVNSNGYFTFSKYCNIWLMSILGFGIIGSLIGIRYSVIKK
jgi:hypothetical protein